MEIDQAGHVVNHEIYHAELCSHARKPTNNEHKIEPDHDPVLMAEYLQLDSMFVHMVALHQILYKMRHARGAIAFVQNVPKIIVEAMGHPTAIVLRERGVSERKLASFMLAAKATVAAHTNCQHYSFLYRD